MTVRFLHKNWLDHADTALSFSSEVASLPGNNILDDLRDRVWRTTGDSEEYVKAALGQAEYANCIAVAGANLSVTGAIIVQGNDSDSWESPAFEEEFDAWEPVIGYGEGWYGEHGYGGYLTQDEIPLYPTIVRFFSAQYYKYWRVVFIDPNNTNGYIDVGRMLVGFYFEPINNFIYGWKLIPVDPSRVSKSLGGQKFVDEKTAYNIVQFTMPGLRQTEAYWQLAKMQQDKGKKKNIFICLDPATPHSRLFTSLYGFMQDDKLLIKQTFLDRHEATINFEEAV